MTEIKTIVHGIESANRFDKEVNTALKDGWQLGARGALPGTPGKKDSHRLLYAELFRNKPDGLPLEMTAPVLHRDPMDAVREIYEGCSRVPQTECSEGRCPLYDWCKSLPNCADPSEWEVPAKC